MSDDSRQAGMWGDPFDGEPPAEGDAEAAEDSCEQRAAHFDERSESPSHIDAEGYLHALPAASGVGSPALFIDSDIEFLLTGELCAAMAAYAGRRVRVHGLQSNHDGCDQIEVESFELLPLVAR